MDEKSSAEKTKSRKGKELDGDGSKMDSGDTKGQVGEEEENKPPNGKAKWKKQEREEKKEAGANKKNGAKETDSGREKEPKGSKEESGEEEGEGGDEGDGDDEDEDEKSSNEDEDEDDDEKEWVVVSHSLNNDRTRHMIGEQEVNNIQPAFEQLIKTQAELP